MATLTKRLDVHFAACAAAAAGAAMISTESNAALVWSGPVSINVPSSFGGVYLNVVTGASGPTSALAGWDVNPYGITYLRLFSNANGVNPDGGHAASPAGNFNLAQNTPIGPASLYTGGVANGGGTTTWNLSSSNNIVGFRFWNEAALQTQYGWYRISLAATIGGQPRTITEYAYGNAGEEVLAGVVPAPGALALLALGGLVGRRRQRVA